MASVSYEQCSTTSTSQAGRYFEETVKSGTAIQEELKSANLLRCVGGQLKSYLSLTIGDNVQYSALREQVLQWDRSQ